MFLVELTPIRELTALVLPAISYSTRLLSAFPILPEDRQTVGPVSYTHLDVYKRQPILQTDITEQLPL